MPKSVTSRINLLVDAIDAAEEELRQAKYYYLKQTGWERSCAFPGAKWYYVKKIGDHTFAVTEDAAVEMQRYQDGC